MKPIEPETELQRLRQENAALQCALRMGGHDLRGSLLAIVMMNHMLVGEDDPGIRTDYFRNIDAMCTRATALIDTYFAVMLSPHPVLSKQDVDLTELVRQVLEVQLAAMSSIRRQAYTVQSRLDPVRLSADPVRLQQVVSNLIDNAFKHTPGGHVRISLSQSRFAIQDEGPTIAAERLPTLFELPAAPGATRGLGLWIARRIVEAHGGTLGCSPSPSGNEFWFTL